MSDGLTPDEKDMEQHADELVSVSTEERKCIEGIVRRARKNRVISLRLANTDLELVKRKAEQEGLPYQTLISMVIHKYVTEQFYDKADVRKILGELKNVGSITNRFS